MNDFIYQVAKFLVELSEKYGDTATPMYDPLAVGVAIDSTLVTAPAMHVEVETRGEFTRGETVANRRNEVERNVLHHFPADSARPIATSSRAWTRWSPTPKFVSKCRRTVFCSFLCPGFRVSKRAPGFAVVAESKEFWRVLR